ncbi:COP9 signalosome complex subunit 1-like [Halichondria panicea]|uniref:COP9 signalosome complex subunit 1-like n=1 Tax=Halichondria panicea TaxID=6063 RepID=UPI00312B671C
MPVPKQYQQMDSVEPMQVDEDGTLSQSNDFIIDNPNFDLDQYANSFQGLAKIRRLMFIAKHCPTLRADALRLSLQTVEGTHNTPLFSELRQRVQQATGDPKYSPDAEDAVTFVTTTNRKAAILLERLDSDLKNYRSNSIKESIRRGFDSLGDHYVDCGELNQALKMYMRARDHCTSSKHIVQLCLNVIKVSVLLGNWQQVLNYYSKADASMEPIDLSKGPHSGVTGAQETACRLLCAAGLAEMQNRKYKNSARLFCAAIIEHCNFPDLLSPYCVAVYGGLCALASFDRQDLYTKVLTSSTFKQYLELEPQLRDVILNFYHSRYTSCLRTLDEMRSSFMLDMYLVPHMDMLYTMIRNRALIQYFSPYLSVDLHKMASAFNTSVPYLEDELTQLILDGQISARIDSHAKIMYARNVDHRSAVFQKVLEVGEAYQLRTKALLIRSLLQKHNICVTHSNDSKSGDNEVVSESTKRVKQ